MYSSGWEYIARTEYQILKGSEVAEVPGMTEFLEMPSDKLELTPVFVSVCILQPV